MRFLFFISVAVVFAYPANGQTCTCESNFEWVKKTFEENDAGFQYVIDKKGLAAYNIHNQLMSEKIKAAETLTECIGLLREWLMFFRSGHIGIEGLINETTNSTSQNVSQTSQSVSQTSQTISQTAQKPETWNPFMDELNATTLYLRIPSFEPNQKQTIDKMLADNKEKILKTENLIIDVRGNGGGSDGSYAELIPFLYTNPIRTIGVEYLFSPILNNQILVELSTLNFDDMDEETRQLVKSVSNKLEGSKFGEFVNLYDNESISIFQQSTVYKYPKKIGIIIDGGCGSTTEQFLLAAKQSNKVKLFGVTTFGALDISNLNDIESPCKEFRLWYCMTRSLRIPEFAIDGIGLQPDYYLDKTIPPHKWVEFVNEILNQ